MENLLTEDQINVTQEFSLHLVLPPSGPPNSHTSPTVPSPNPHGFFQVNGPQVGSPMPANVQQGVGGGLPQRPFVPNPAFHPGHFPVPQMHSALQNHIQMLGQQITAQVAMHGNQPMAHGLPGASHGPNLQHPAHFQQIIAQQQQARAAAGHLGIADPAVSQNENGESETSRRGTAAPVRPNNSMAAPSGPPSTNTIVQENRGPNNENWRMVIQSTSTVTGLNPTMPRINTPVNLGILPSPNPATQVGTPSPVNPQDQQSSAQRPLRAPNQLQLRILEQEMTAIQTALVRGTAPAPSVFEAARRSLRTIENINETPGLEAMLRTQLEGLSVQADQLRANLNNILLQAVSNQPSQLTALQTLSTPLPSQNSAASSVYILSSPSGPQALLVSPSGMFSTTWNSLSSGNTGLPLILQHNNHTSNVNQPNNTNDGAAVGQPRIIPADGAQAPQQPQVQANEVRDLLRLLLPLGGHIWLLVRLFGFVYFFTAGGSSRRAFFLGGIAFLVFIAQAGIFRPFIRALWDPLRRHVEGLVVGNEENPHQPAALTNAPTAGAVNAQNRNREPTPQEAAGRLLQERDRRTAGTMREQLRGVERAVALFIGSLVPGFGERHIAARDAAEAVRQAEAREREEAARRAEEEATRREASAAADGESSLSGSQQPGQQEAQTPDQAAEAPLVEV